MEQGNNMNEQTSTSSQQTNEPEATSKSEADQAATALKSRMLAEAEELKDEAKQVADDVMNRARQSAESRIAGGKDRIAEGLGSFAEAIRKTGENLRQEQENESGITEYVTRAASRVEAASEYLQERDLRDVLSDLGDFARREPAFFLGGAFALGLVGGRFLKSSKATASTAPGTGQTLSRPQKPRRPNGGRRSRGGASRNNGPRDEQSKAVRAESESGSNPQGGRNPNTRQGSSGPSEDKGERGTRAPGSM